MTQYVLQGVKTFAVVMNHVRFEFVHMFCLSLCFFLKKVLSDRYSFKSVNVLSVEITCLCLFINIVW